MGIADQKAIEAKIAQGKKEEKKAMRKRQKELLKKEKVSFFTDFKNFITKGNVLDLAVALVISTAFNAIVKGLVNDIIIRSARRTPRMLSKAKNILYPMMKGISATSIASNALLPIPGRPNTCSVMIAPEKRPGSSPASEVTRGIIVFLNACL